MQAKIENIMNRFDFEGKPASLQYWKNTSVGYHEWSLSVAGQPSRSYNDKKGLKLYRKTCLSYGEVRNGDVLPDGQPDCFACLAAETRVPHERTDRDPTQCLGQLVVPVFRCRGGKKVLEGVIELVTFDPKRSYASDLNQIKGLLQILFLLIMVVGNINNFILRCGVVVGVVVVVPSGAARNWFDDLDPKSVDNFEELSQKFLEEFSQQKRYAKDPTEIHGIKRRINEGMQAFMDRFKSESSHIKGIPPVLRVSAFMHGHGHPEPAKKLNDKIPKMVDVTTVV
ncbi:reverse transcriptase domain-containing protein [Tanacetum coccineum]